MPPLEDRFYEIAAREVMENNVAPAAWGKALSGAMGDKEKLTALYVKFRVNQLAEEHERSWKEAVFKGHQVECPFCHKLVTVKRVINDFFVRLFSATRVYCYFCPNCTKTLFENDQ